MKRLVLGVMTATAAALAHSADVPFPDKDGSHDISSAAAWGGAIPTEETASLAAGGEFVATADVTFPQGLQFWAGESPITIDLTGADPVRTITLGATGNVRTGSKLTLKGGVYDYQGSWTPIRENAWNSNLRKDMELVFDGVTITNVGARTTVCYYGSSGNNKLAFQNGAVWHQTAGEFDLTYAGNGGNVLTVSSGSTFYCKKMFTMQRGSSYKTPGGIVVEGAGTCFDVGGAGSFCTASGETLTVRDGALMKMHIFDSNQGSYFYFGNASSANACMLFDGSADGCHIAAQYFRGSNNVIRVRNASLTAGAAYGTSSPNDWSFGNGFDVIDSSVQLNAIGATDTASCTNFFLRVSGDHPVISMATRSGNESEMLKSYSRLICDLPAGGYRSGVIPFLFNGAAYMDATTSFEIENLDEIRAGMGEEVSRTYRLARFYTANGLDAAVSASNKKVGSKASFAVVNGDDGEKFVDVTVMGNRLPISVGGTVTWPSADKFVVEGAATEYLFTDGDISRSEMWQDAANMTLRFVAGGDYLIPHGDVTFGAIEFFAPEEWVVLDFSGSTVSAGRCNFATRSKVRLCDGTFDLKGKAAFIPENSWEYNRRRDMEIVLDNVKVTNGTQSVMNYYGGAHNTLSLTNGASYHQSAGLFRLSYSSGGDTLVDIAAGCSFIVPGGVSFAHTSATTGSTVRVSGPGALFAVGASTAMQSANGHRLLVSDGAALKMGGWWDFGGNGCRLEVSDAMPSKLGSPYFRGCNNVMRIRNTTLSAGLVYLAVANCVSVDSSFEIDDSDVIVDSMWYEEEKCAPTNFVVRMSGDRPTLTLGNLGSVQSSRFKGVRLVFDLPVSGYVFGDAERIAPLVSNQATYLNGETSFEVEGLDAIKADLSAQRRSSRKYCLMQLNAHNTGVSAAVAHSNEIAPEGVSFFVEGNCVWAKVKIPCDWGFMIQVR